MRLWLRGDFFMAIDSQVPGWLVQEEQNAQNVGPEMVKDYWQAAEGTIAVKQAQQLGLLRSAQLEETKAKLSAQNQEQQGWILDAPEVAKLSAMTPEDRQKAMQTDAWVPKSTRGYQWLDSTQNRDEQSLNRKAIAQQTATLR